MGGDEIGRLLGKGELVSIHAPRMGGDSFLVGRRPTEFVSIHAPRMGGDNGANVGSRCANLFQSTPPAWGATLKEISVEGKVKGFNPRPPHGGRHDVELLFAVVAVSIHAPRMGGDRSSFDLHSGGKCFNPRPPHGGRPR